jgi:outer membrane murein-binding lipoprotein Lpp
MSALLQIGAFLLDHWAVALAIAAILFAASLYAFGLSVFAFLRSPLGIALGIVLALLLVAAGGYSQAQRECNAAQLAAKVAALEAEKKELRDQLDAGDAIIARDNKRANDAEAEAERLKGIIDATPVNHAACLSRDAARRLRNVK